MPLPSISDTIERAFTAAGLNGRQGAPKAVLDTIRQALASAGIGGPAQPTAGPSANADATTVDAVRARHDTDASDAPPAASAASAAAAAPGRFLAFKHATARGERAYKLYVPTAYDGTTPLPLVVMLHGCKQDPDDFSRGTRMNALGEEHGVLVAYPQQSAAANGSNCWRWFEAQEQARDGAEPSIIAGIVGAIAASHRVDSARLYVAGLSAGGAMAAILGETHPELFAAVGVHSGLPRGAARDVASAFAAMHGGTPAAALARPPAQGRPLIVFHGAADATVVPANGEAVAQRAVAGLSAAHGALTAVIDQPLAGEQRCQRTVHVAANGTPLVEQWLVPGAGHLWFGGSRAGSFAGPEGPDASREMLRFFLQHTRSAG